MREITSKITSKGQVTIPVEVRRHLGVSVPDKVTFIIDGPDVRLRPAKYTLKSAMGAVKALPGTSADFEREIEEAKEEAVERLVRKSGGG